MSDGFIAKFVNSKIMTEGGDAVPLDVRLDGTDAMIGEVKEQAEEIKANVAKKARTYFTTIANTPIATTDTVILSLAGAGTINTIAFQPFSAGTHNLTITIDGAVLISASIAHGSVAGDIHSVITIGGPNGIRLSSILSNVTSIPFLYSNFLNINYSKSIEISFRAPFAINANIHIGHTREV